MYYSRFLGCCWEFCDFQLGQEQLKLIRKYFTKKIHLDYLLRFSVLLLLIMAIGDEVFEMKSFIEYSE